MNQLFWDLRYATRVLAKSPGVTWVAVLALAIGIGVNTSSFTAVNALVLNPLPFPRLDRVMTLWETIPKLRAEWDTVAPANLVDWKEQSRSFEHIAAYHRWDVSLTGLDDPERVQGYLVSFSFFSLLGIKPALGRTFSSEEADAGHNAVVVVSHGFWQRRLSSAPDAVGKTIALSGASYTIVGVMPDVFDFPLATDVWSPLIFTPEEKQQRAARNLQVLARLKPDVPVAQARAEMDAIARRLEQQYPQTNEARGIAVVPLREITNSVASRFVLILMGSAVFVLLLACANVANLQLARATGRQKEIAIRAALGASRLQIARQLLLESVLISLAGASLGILLASWDLDWTRATFPPQVYRWMSGLRLFYIDGRVVAFTLASSLLAGILCYLPTIFQLLRRTTAVDLGECLKEGGRSNSGGPARSRLRSALAISEVALALVLLVGAGLMVKTFQRMLTFNAGFNPKNVLSMQVSLPATKYAETAQRAAFYDRVLHGLEALPEVKAAGGIGYMGTPEDLFVEGRPASQPGEPRPNLRAASEHYLEAMGIPVLAGRSIAARDGVESPRVVVVSESIARHYWPNSDPIGRRIKLGNAQSSWLTVVGVCGDTRNWFTAQPQPAAYIPFVQAPRFSMNLVMRTRGDPMQAARGARLEVHNVDRNQPVYDLKSMDQIMFEETSGVRASANTMSLYAAIALLLAATGIYAVISYSVAQRTHEIGVRVALGAARADIVKMVIWQALRMAGVGLAIGIPAAFVLTHAMSSALFNVVAIDAFTFAAFAAVLALSALLAGYIPARRATRLDPVVALHHE